ncbi:MAG: hypothetical protein AAGF12_18990 [Myxococcota bacterium]
MRAALPWVLAFVCGACGDDSPPPSSNVMPEAGMPTDGGFALPLPEAGGDGNCSAGERRACECSSGLSGEEVCIGGEEWSECGCTSGAESVFVPPPPPVINTCGFGANQVTCRPYPEPDTPYSASHCCIEGECGSGNPLIMGGVCLPRPQPAPIRSSACPDESIAFVDMTGCCMPSGMCGLALDETLPNWDVGCIERSQMHEVLDQGIQRKFIAQVIFGFDPTVPEWESMPCTFGQ